MLKVFSKCPEFKSVHVCVCMCVCVCVLYCVWFQVHGCDQVLQNFKKVFFSVRFQRIPRPETKTVKNGPLSFCFPLSYVCVCVCVCVCV